MSELNSKIIRTSLAIIACIGNAAIIANVIGYMPAIAGWTGGACCIFSYISLATIQQRDDDKHRITLDPIDENDGLEVLDPIYENDSQENLQKIVNANKTDPEKLLTILQSSRQKDEILALIRADREIVSQMISWDFETREFEFIHSIIRDLRFQERQLIVKEVNANPKRIADLLIFLSFLKYLHFDQEMLDDLMREVFKNNMKHLDILFDIAKFFTRYRIFVKKDSKFNNREFYRFFDQDIGNLAYENYNYAADPTASPFPVRDS